MTPARHVSSSAPIGENVGWYDLPVVGEDRLRKARARKLRRVAGLVAGAWAIALVVLVIS